MHFINHLIAGIIAVNQARRTKVEGADYPYLIEAAQQIQTTRSLNLPQQA